MLTRSISPFHWCGGSTGAGLLGLNQALAFRCGAAGRTSGGWIWTMRTVGGSGTQTTSDSTRVAGTATGRTNTVCESAATATNPMTIAQMNRRHRPTLPRLTDRHHERRGGPHRLPHRLQSGQAAAAGDRRNPQSDGEDD